jgi:GNAT superfamily N-acetyltransferase
MSIELKIAELSDVPLIQSLAEQIWKKHYTEIISKQQIEYMLEKMYSTKKLSEEINLPNYDYYIAYVNDKATGFFAISKEKEDNYLLNKFYILQSQQSTGLGQIIFNQVFEKKNYKKIELFVNRQNFKSINFYFKLGFKITAVVDNHIGENYYMNDFIMQKLNQNAKP